MDLSSGLRMPLLSSWIDATSFCRMQDAYTCFASAVRSVERAWSSDRLAFLQ